MPAASAAVSILWFSMPQWGKSEFVHLLLQIQVPGPLDTGVPVHLPALEMPQGQYLGLGSSRIQRGWWDTPLAVAVIYV